MEPVTSPEGKKGFYDESTGFIPIDSMEKVTNPQGVKGYYSDTAGFVPEPSLNIAAPSAKSIPQRGFLENLGNYAKEAILGIPEAALSLGTGAVASGAGEVAGAITAAIEGTKQGINSMAGQKVFDSTNVPWGRRATDIRNATSELLTYQPSTESGKALAEFVGSGLSVPFRAASKLVSTAGKVLAAPVLGEYPTAEKYPNLDYTLETAGNTAALGITPRAAISKAGEIGKIAPKVAEKAFNLAVDYGLNKGIRQFVKGRGTYPLSQKKIATGRDMVASIIENKNNLELTDPTTGESMTAGSLPSGKNSVVQMAQAADQTKRVIRQQSDAMKIASDGKGIEADLSPVVGKLESLKKDKVFQRHPDVMDYIDQQKEYFGNLKKLSLEDMDREIADYNAHLKAFTESPDYNKASQVLVDADVVDILRESLDNSITSTEGPGFQELKNKYGSILDHEKEINQRVVVDARRNPKGFFDLGNIPIYGELARAMIKPDIGSAAFAGGGYLAKKYMQYKNNPNTIVSNMFKKADKYHGHYGTELPSPLSPVGAPEPRGIPVPTNPFVMEKNYVPQNTPIRGSIEFPPEISTLMLEKDYNPPAGRNAPWPSGMNKIGGPQVGPGTTQSSVIPGSNVPYRGTVAEPPAPIVTDREMANYFYGTIPETSYAPGAKGVPGISPDTKVYWVNEMVKRIAAEEMRKKFGK